jgi:hypothetical protein
VSTTAPSLLILGTDTVLAATPATAVQLSHACLAAGFDAVVPASWGDELVAARVLERVQQRDGPVIQCSCPRVLERLAANGDAIEPMLICTVSPAAAAAEYLRAIYAPVHPTITFAGGCAGGASDGIDRWLPPAQLFAYLAERGVSATTQPTEFERLPPDRRRHHSEPGGTPSRAALQQVDASMRCIEVEASDFVMAVGQHLLSSERVLLDLAPALGCLCAGAAQGTSVIRARARVREHEPPRAPSPIVDHAVPVVLDAELPRIRRSAPQPIVASAIAEVALSASRSSAPIATVAPPPPPTEPPRRRSPTGLPRPVFGAAPRSSRPDGRALPRAYVARRRSSPRGMRTIPGDGGESDGGLRGRLWWTVGGVIAGAGLVILLRLLG